MSLSGTTDNSIEEVIYIFYKHAPFVFSQKTKLEKQTPLHFAMKSGNIQKAKCILNAFCKAKDMVTHDKLFNFRDFNGMRPIDLLSIRQDTEYKKYVAK